MIAEEETRSNVSEEGENYFVSMTDMMIGVLFIFIIMLMVFALDFRTKTDVQEDAIAIAREVAKKLQELQHDVRTEIATLDEAQRRRDELLQTLQQRLQAEGLDVEIDEVTGVLRLTEESVRFDVDRSDLTVRAAQNVAKIAKVFLAVLPEYAACVGGSESTECKPAGKSTIETVFIEGHTDTTGLDERNWQLSTERAVNTYRELINVAPGLRALHNRRRNEIISVSGYSSTRAIDSTSTTDAWLKNRRIDLRFVMEVDSRPRLHQILSLTDEMKTEIEKLMRASGD